jgi:hypothetical protein
MVFKSPATLALTVVQLRGASVPVMEIDTRSSRFCGCTRSLAANSITGAFVGGAEATLLS